MAGKKWRKAYGVGNGMKILKHPSGQIATEDECCCPFVSCLECPYGTSQEGYPVSDPIVDTLYARVTAVEGCECLDGICIPLIWEGAFGHQDGTWQGTIAIPDCTNLPEDERYLTLVLRCCQTELEGYPEYTFWLGSDDCSAGASPARGSPCPTILPPINHSQPQDVGGTCRPYSLTFTNFPGLNCCGVMPATFDIAISETPC